VGGRIHPLDGNEWVFKIGELAGYLPAYLYIALLMHPSIVHNHQIQN